MYTTEKLLAEIAAGKGLSLRQVVAQLPRSRNGAPVSPSCAFRWATTGVRAPDGSRVYLETVRCGCRLLTSAEALQRFLAAQTGQVQPEAGPTVRPPHRRRRESAQATAKLADMGIA